MVGGEFLRRNVWQWRVVWHFCSLLPPCSIFAAPITCSISLVLRDVASWCHYLRSTYIFSPLGRRVFPPLLAILPIYPRFRVRGNVKIIALQSSLFLGSKPRGERRHLLTVGPIDSEDVCEFSQVFMIVTDACSPNRRRIFVEACAATGPRSSDCSAAGNLFVSRRVLTVFGPAYRYIFPPKFPAFFDTVSQL